MSKLHLPVIGMPQVGTPGIRDIHHPCEVFEYGDPKGDCETDGHYMCKECRHRKWAVDMDTTRFERLIFGEFLEEWPSGSRHRF